MATAKPKLNFDVDFSSDADIAPIAEVAWNKVRGKDDASFAAAVEDFKRHLINHARSALTTSAILQGKTNMALFEQEVARLKGEAKKEAN
jgi:hypothetical protein